MKLRRIVTSLLISAALAVPVAANITSTSLRIEGAGLAVHNDPPVTTGLDIPSTIQTSFGGKRNEESSAPVGLTAVGELTGPGLDTPIPLTTSPGYKFQIPGLSKPGIYYLQNIRLVKGDEFLQYATPATTQIIVADLLQTKIKVRQLSPDELRARGIVIDARNFDVYEFSFTFIIDGQEVVIPFPVIVDPRTHQVQPLRGESPYVLPQVKQIEPPRWTPPEIIPLDFGEEGDLPEPGQDPKEKTVRAPRPSLPAAIVIPNNIAVLHQFFAVQMMVTNGAPPESAARLENIRATLRVADAGALRTVKTLPQVSFGQPVPIVEPDTGATFLVAQGRGEAEWTLEGLRPGTHRIDFDLRATLKQPGQDDVLLRATPSAAVVIHDPRFNITFSHPDVVRKGIEYSTYAFITNLSESARDAKVENFVTACKDAPPDANVCRLSGDFTDLMHFEPGETKLVEYRLRPGVTGQVFATAGTLSDTDVLSADVRLHMGVSPSGIPLSPKTLVLPYYAQFVSPAVVSANLELFGLGFSLATAPLTPVTARFPRVIKTDVFTRAVDLSRAGQRIFITNDAPEAKRDSIMHMALDLLGNGGYDLREWDALRRSEESGRKAGAAIVRELEATALTGSATMTSFVEDFARVTAHRSGYVMALAHGTGTGARPYALSLAGKTSGREAKVNNEGSGWTRDLPYADISSFNGAGESGELAFVARWTEDVDLKVTPSASGPFTLDVIYPAAEDGSLLRARFTLEGTAGQAMIVPLTRGVTSLQALFPLGGIASVGTVTEVEPDDIRILGARQDLYLDKDGHKVSVLFNRPIVPGAGIDLRTRFGGEIDFNADGVVYKAPRPISAAALQEDGRTVNTTFDHTLSVNATYKIEVKPVVDPLSSQTVSFPDKITPKIDNDSPAGIVYGRVLKGDGSPIGGVDVVVRQYLPNDGSPDPKGSPQYDVSQTNGDFLYEFVRRQIDLDWTGRYRLEAISSVHGYAVVEGSVRLPGKVHRVNLQYLGRGSAEGRVTYNDGTPVVKATVTVGSTMFDQFRTAETDGNGRYKVEDLPVGPLTFSAQDGAGNVTYAANEVATPGQVVTQNLSIFRAPFPGLGRVYGVVRRSDNDAPVAGARVAIYSQGYGLSSAISDSEGRFDFPKVPAGFVTLLAAEFSVAPEAAALDFDLKADEVRAETVRLFVAAPTLKYVTMTGLVRRERPNAPGTFEVVPGALVKISGYKLATANANGEFIYENLPNVLETKEITAYDPVTQRVKTVQMPTLTEAGPNHVEITILAFDRGSGTIRVRLLNAAGKPVPGYRVIEPGFPPEVLQEVGPGIYEMRNVGVGPLREIWAVPQGERPMDGSADTRQYGDQVAHGEAAVAFNGHIAALTLRLPGQGTVRVKVRSQFDLISDVNLSYPVWYEGEQMMISQTLRESTNKNGIADYAVFTKIPALTNYGFASAHPQYGNAGGSSALAFDGDLDEHVLQLNTLSKVSGTVYAIDGVTPIAGATVRIHNGRSDPGPQFTGPDGRFEFFDQPSDVTVHVTAEVTLSGIYRIGTASAYTPRLGGVIDNMSVVLRKRGFVDGKVVYKDYKRFDADHPENNIPDDTPNDYSDNAPVPLARFVLRELEYPQRSFGSMGDPLVADANGRIFVNNVFTGGLRATAWDSGNEELRGGWAGSIEEEGAEALPKAYIPIGGGGVGSLEVTVRDPNQSYREIENADVTLGGHGRIWDFSTTGAGGVARFDEIPIGTYSVSSYSKSLGKASDVKSFTITRDQVTRVSLELIFSGSVDGTLTDPEEGNAPVPGSHVRLTASSFQTQSTTDVNGRFEFLGVRAGSFRLDAKDTDTNRRASAERAISILDPHRTVNLVLEPIETLHFAAYLPNDTGGNSGILAPLQKVEVTQRCWRDLAHKRHCDYERQLQGNPIQFPGVFENSGYSVGIFEPGKDQIEARLQLGGAFPKGTAADPFVYVFPAYGDVRIEVTQGGAPASGVKLMVYSPEKQVVLYTDATGAAIARGLRLGAVGVQAASSDERFTGSTSVQLERSSVVPVAKIALGTYAGVTGRVIAEAGGPSIGTRVVAHYGPLTGEARTDDEGRYTFLGIPTSGTGATRVHLTFIGPDDTTVGGSTFKDVFAGDGVKTVGDVRIDATVPQFESITPADNSINVSPDTSIRVSFSEPLNPATISHSTFQLVAGDGSGTINCILSTTTENGLFTVVMKPPVPATGFPLKSNTLYRVILTNGIRDLTGHALPASLGFGFTTSDYAEPRVLKVLPANPIPRTTTFEFRFNEPVDPAPWNPGGNGVHEVYELKAPGGPGAEIERRLVSDPFLDPYNMILFIALDDAADNRIEPESYYRVVFDGVKDLQGNPMPRQTYHFKSFDEVAPHVTFDTPSTAEPLTTGSEYEVKLVFRSGPGGPIADDIKHVRYYTYNAQGVAEQWQLVTKEPFTVKLLGPDAPAAGTTYSLGAQATDTSGNEGPLVKATWNVLPNAAPKNVVVTPVQPALYPGKKAQVRVSFDDEGSWVSVLATFSVLKNDGSTDTKNVSKEVRRMANGQWENPLYEYDVPATAKAGENVNVSVVVADVRGLAAAPATAAITVLADTVQPQILLVSPPAGTSFTNTQKYTIEATVSDADTGVQTVTFLVDGEAVATASSETLPNGTQRFRSVQVETRAKADDANIPIVVTAKDYAGNTKSTAFELLYRGVNDPDAPKVSWICPSDRGALPAETNLPLKLRVKVVDQDIRSVKFKIGEQTVDATVTGTNEYGYTHTFTTPAPGTLTITAIVEDTVATHKVELPIVLDLIAADFKFLNATQAIHAGNAGTYTDKTIAVLSGGVLAPQVPVQLANLIVVNGGRIETVYSSPTREVRADLTVTGVTYVDCDSSVNVNERGYVGGWNNTDGEINNDHRGYTVGNTPVGGATDGAQASHAGLGGIWIPGATTNAPYGSIQRPTDLGSGGSGAAGNSGYYGTRGGGAIRIQGGTAEGDVSRVVLAGKLTADGGDGSCGQCVAGGSGGSIWVEAKQVLLGPLTKMTANGGDDGGIGGATSLGAGGGRISVVASTKLDVNAAVLEARGGHIHRGDGEKDAGNGGAGTVYLRKPGQEAGELIVSAHDTRFPNAQHWSRPTPIGRIGKGTSTAIAANALTDTTRTFDRWMVGEDVVLAGDVTKSYTVVAISADGKSLQTDPNDGSMLLHPSVNAGSQTVAYAGKVTFDKLTAGPRALLVFDQHVSVAGSVDDKTVMSIAPSAAVLLAGEQPVLTLTSTPAVGANIIRDTPLSVTYSVSAAAGVRTLKLKWSPEGGAERTDDLTTYPTPTPEKTVSLPVPSTTPLGDAMLTFSLTDRAGRSYTLPVRTWQIVDNAAPALASFTIAPGLSIHAGRDVVASVNATDDIAVKTIVFDALLNGTSVKTQTFTPNTATASATFTVPVDPSVAGGSTLQINVTVSDGFAGRPTLQASQTVTILPDTVAPAISVVTPAAGSSYRESVDKIPVRITAVDAEVKVKEAYAQIDGGTPVALAPIAGTSDWKVDVLAPPVDGSQPVQGQLTITAKDFAGNVKTSDPIALTFTPVVDASAPKVSWACASPGAMFPLGTAVKLRVNAVGVIVNGQPNPVQAVEMYVDDSQTPLTATQVPSTTQYEATYTLPAGTTDGTTFRVRAIARSAGGAASDVVTTFTAVAIDSTISQNTTIDATTTSYDHKSVLITGGTVTIRGPHTFDRLLVLGGNVVHVKGEKVDVTTARGVYVGCLGAIDVSGLGYGRNESYPGERTPAHETGGSHIGRGGSTNGSNLPGSTFGSIYRPQEAGGGGEGYVGAAGGGIVHIQGQSLVVDGAVRAMGTREHRGGAGGSIWIRTAKIAGAGTVDAGGSPANYGGGGGGAVAIEYTDPASVLPVLKSFGGRDDTTWFHRNGSAGSVYVRGPQSTYGDLTFDSDVPAWAELPSLGSGTAQPSTAGATVVTNLAKDIQQFFKGHWVEVETASGTLKGTWRIDTITGKSFTLAPNAAETIDVQPGDIWRGVYRFDNVSILRGGGLGSADPLRIANKATVTGMTSGEGYIRTNLDAPRMEVTGGVTAAHHLAADEMTVAAGAVLTHPTIGTGLQPGLTIEGRTSLVMNGTVDVSARGYQVNATYPGERAAAHETGGSHMGRGGSRNGSNPSGNTFGSVYRPREAGGAGDWHAHYAGGIARIKAGTLLLDGAIKSNATRHFRGGSGGSVWITATKITGSGSINTDGMSGDYGAGGGGAISIEYTDPTSVLPAMSNSGGRDDNNVGHRHGGAGTTYLRGPQSTFGDLIVDNAVPDAQLTELPSMGNGTALAGSSGATVVTNRSADWPVYYEGHWVEITDAVTNVLKGTWRVASVSGRSFTLAPNGTETISIATGDKWQGVYRFDNVELRRYARIDSVDPIRTTGDVVLAGPASSEMFLRMPLSAKKITVTGRVAAYDITADDLTIAAGAVLTHPTISTDIKPGLTLNVKNTLTIDGSIDVTARGYQVNATYPGERVAGHETGGSHIGRGGSRNGTNLSGTTFGSIYRPREAGGAGDWHMHHAGGIVRISAATVLVNGSIRSNATRNFRGGSGGSVWITTNRIAGAGSITTDGMSGDYGAGGGGAISIEYSDPTSVLPALSSSGGRDDNGVGYRNGGAGSIYLKGPQATYGHLVIDNAVPDAQLTELPSMGSGTALAGSSGATVVTNRATAWPVYYEGHWVEITDAATNVLKGTWRVASVSGKSFTLAPNGAETISVATGDKWQGVYRFDKVELRRYARVDSIDPFRVTDDVLISGTAASDSFINIPLSAKRVEISGRLSAYSISGDEMVINANAVLTHPTVYNGIKPGLTLNVKNTLTINGTIDVTARGYEVNATYPGERAAAHETGGSHMGRGGSRNGSNLSGTTFGSVYRPREAGGAGDWHAHHGGGIVRIDAGNVLLNGAIRSNASRNFRGGSGGSVWITTGKISGTGLISTDGMSGDYGAGGGGAISVEYTDPTSVLPTMSSFGGRDDNNVAHRHAAAGTVYVKGPSMTHGELTIANNITSTQATQLPSLGRGTALAGSAGATVVTDLAANIQPYFAGHWVEVLSPGGTLEGSFRIASIDGKTFTLEPNGSSTPSVEPGDLWRGVYQFDLLKVRGNQSVQLLDEVRGSKQIEGGSSLTINDPPLVNLTAITVESRQDGDFVVGTIGAVQDLHQPVVVTIINNRTGVAYPSINAAADGSFSVSVAANVGDTFSIRARDSFSLSASTRTYPISGAVVATNGIELFGVTPASVIGGASATGTVRMRYPVRHANDTIVTLLSSSPQATVPATVTIPVGMASVSFPIATAAVSQDTQVQLTASAGTTQGVAATFDLLSGTSALTDLQLDASTVQGGTSINATASIGAASSDGVVFLTSSNPQLAKVPEFVTIASGQTSVTFTVTTYAVAADSSFSITASHGGSSIARQASLTACTAMGTVATPAAPSLAQMWIDDTLPAGATQTGDGAIDTTQAASGSAAIHLSGATAGTRAFTITGAAALTVTPSDNLVVYALVNPCNPPRQIVVTWTAGTTEYAAAWGESRLTNAANVPYTRRGVLPRGGDWVRLEVPARTIGFTAASTSVTGFSARALDGEAWIDAVGTTACSVPPNQPAPALHPNEQVWFDDSMPAGAVTPPATGHDSAWQWTTTQAASGTSSHLEAARSATHQHSFTAATSPLGTGQGDVLFTYVYIDPCNPPRQLMLQWNDGTSWEHRAYWGENVVPNHLVGSNRVHIAPMPEAGKWVRLDVPAEWVGLAGRGVAGMAFTLYDGQAWFDRTGKVARVNVALRKTATQSTDHTANDPASRAVDGNIATGHGSMSVTANTFQPWWQVDLGAVYPIDTIDVYGRTDCCNGQTSSFHLFVSDVPFTSNTWDGVHAQAGVGSYGFPGTANTRVSTKINRTGRYVRIQKSNHDHLSIPEVQVWSPAVPQRVNLAGGRTTSTTASSQYDGWTYPHFAVNGAGNSYASQGSIYHVRSGGATDPWWEVDLGSVQAIGNIEMWARLDCCLDQMANLYAFVSDVPFASATFAGTRDQAGVAMYHQPFHHWSVNLPVERTGRYVRIQKPGNGQSFSFSEIYVWGPQAVLPAFSRNQESPPER